MRPMLAVTVDSSTIGKLATGRDWAFSQKMDGRRGLFLVDSPKVVMYGRNGRRVAPPEKIKRALMRLPEGRFILDGEVMADGYLYLFDAPSVTLAGRDIVTMESPYADRIEVLATLVKSVWQPAIPTIQLLPRATSPEHKLRLLTWIKNNGGEGIVARKMDAPYLPGVRSPGMAKLKWVKALDCFVTGIGEGGKANLVLSVYDEKGSVIEIGKVSALTADGPKAKLGTVLDVTYLSFSKDGRLIQPVNPKIRFDKTAKQCLLQQLTPVNMKEVGVLRQ